MKINFGAPAAPLAIIATMSLVDVSPLIDMRLYDLSAAVDKSCCEATRVAGASVQMMPKVVAMLEWMIPAPLVMPAILKVIPGDDRRVNVREATSRNVSVVQIPLATSSQFSCDFSMC